MPFLNHLNFDTVHAVIKHLAETPDAVTALARRNPDEAMLPFDALKLMAEALGGVASPGLCELAREIHGDDEVEIDDEGAGTSPSADGTWVQAWVWVERDALVEAGLADADAEEDEEEDDEEVTDAEG